MGLGSCTHTSSSSIYCAILSYNNWTFVCGNVAVNTASIHLQNPCGTCHVLDDVTCNGSVHNLDRYVLYYYRNTAP